MSKNLYERLGATTGIATLVDDIVDAHMNNPAIKARFLPYRDDPAHLASVKRHTCEFLGAGSGGPEQYSGRGMNVSAEEFMAAIDDILSALDKHKIDEQTRKDVLAIAYSLKEQIIHA